MLAIVPAAQQSPATDFPVHATLRPVGERTTFKIGEPIRFQLVLTADKPGFIADTFGADDPSDVLIVSPENGVHRLEGRGGRDVFTASKLTAEPAVIDLAANYWVRFDRAGTYTVSIQTRRVSPAGGKSLLLTTNAITFRLEQPNPDDEQELIASAARNLQSAVAMGLGDRAFNAQIRAAEELAFLTGDAAAVEKYRWFKELGSRNDITGNARDVLRRGFVMSRNPGVILAAVEAELQDLNQAVSSDMLFNAASLAVTIKYPGVRLNSWLPKAPGGSDPFSMERARYLDSVHESLERRSGLARLLSAGAMLDVLVTLTPPDVVRIIVDGFEQLPVSSRVWFASGRWEVIRDVRLAPGLRRTLEEVESGSRSYIFPALIDIAPSLAVEPISVDILDPKRLISAEIVRKIPRSSLSHLAPQLLAVIRTMSNGRNVDTFRLDRKVELLGIIADGAVRKDVLEIYDALPDRYMYGTRESLLRYLLEWDPDEGTRRLKAALDSNDQGSLLYKISKDGPALPALSSLLQERLFDRDLKVAANAAGLLSSHRQQDRDALERRLVQWRVDRQQRLANGESLTEADGAFESALVRPLSSGPNGKLATADRERMLAACLTESCRAALRER